MPYQLLTTDTSVAAGVRRIACEQIDSALASLDDPADPEESFHNVRTRCKRLRGLLRLVRPELAGFRSENAVFRDTARALSGLREANVLQDTYDRLVEGRGDGIDRHALGQIRRRFTVERNLLLKRIDLADRFAECREALFRARDRVSGWTIAHDGWDGIARGVAGTFARARSAAEAARDDGTATAFHELRKPLKYHLYHAQLLRGLWPGEMKLREELATRVTDLLGDHNDLAVFEQRIADRWTFKDRQTVEAALALSADRRSEVLVKAWPLIGRLLADKPGALARRWGALWANWHRFPA